MAKLQVQKVNWWHERLADWMLANPDKHLKEAAKEFDVTPTAIYLIHNSDCFQIYWATRTDDYSKALEGQTIERTTALQQKAAAVAEAALEELGDRLTTQGTVIPIGTLLDISKMGLTAAGMTANKKTGAPTVNINLNAVDPTALERARKRIEELHGQKVEEARAREQDAIASGDKLLELKATEV